MNSKFCPLPWIFQAVRNNGDIRVCCQANGSTSKGIYRKEDGTAYNVASDSLEESRNCQLAKDIRLSMLAGETHEACLRCDQEDAAGISSRRQYEGRNWAHHITLDSAHELTEEDGTITNPVIYYDLRFGNLCNLKCRMCGPTDSSMWYDDQVSVWGDEYNDAHGRVKLTLNEKGKYWPENDDYGWINNADNFWGEIEKNIPNIQHIHTVGGEPLMINQQYDLLQKCIDQGYAKNIKIEYNTNVVNIPERAWNIWKHFKIVQIGASVDGVGAVNDYIRKPSKWKYIEQNLQRLDIAEGNFRIWIACTVQVYNILHLPEFMKWKIEQNFDKINQLEGRLFLTTHPLHNPRHLNIRILPKESKQLILNRFHEFYIWLDKWIIDNNKEKLRDKYFNDARLILDSYAKYMMQEDWSDTLQKFWSYTKKLDVVRNETFENIFPELYETIKNYVK